MPKKKNQEFNSDGHPVRKSEFDENREAYMTKDGGYTYCQWFPVGKDRWELRPTCTVHIGEDEVTADVTNLLDDMDCEDDRRNNQIRKHRDKIFDEKCADYDAAPTSESGNKKTDPWEKASYDLSRGKDLADQFYPDDTPIDPRMEKLMELMDELTEDQRDLIYAHLGERKQFIQIAREESARKGKPVSRQAISNRWDRILTRLCKGFGVEKPVRRNDQDDEE